MGIEYNIERFLDWQKNMKTLVNKGVKGELLAKLLEVGPKAGVEIATLNTLTDVQLKQYINLWEEQNAIAKEREVEMITNLKENYKPESMGLAEMLEGLTLDSLADDDYNAIITVIKPADLSKPLKYRGE